MTIHVTYEAWTYSHVKARIIEAAETLMLTAPDRGPGFAGLMGDIVREVAESYGYGSTSIRRIPSPGALQRMEETWAWINTYLDEADRRLVYDYGYLMTRKGLTITKWCERNGWIKRTFERAVNRACQRIADNLNRNLVIRLTVPVDLVSQNQSEHASTEVASDNRALVKRTPYHRADDAIPVHIPGTEAEIAKYIEKVNKQRREEAERRRQEALRKAEDAERLAVKCAERAARRKREAA